MTLIIPFKEGQHLQALNVQQESKPFHIVSFRFSSLGDVILSTSLFHLLRKIYGPKLRLSFYTSKAMAPILENHPLLDAVYLHSRQKGLRDFKELKKTFKKIHKDHPVDLIIDHHGSLRTLFLRFSFLSIPRIVLDKRTIERWLLTTFKVDFLSRQFNKIEKRKKRLGELLLRRNARDVLPLFSSEDDLHWVEETSPLSSAALKENEGSRKKIIAFIPSASFPEKRWSAEKFYQLIETTLESEEFSAYKLKVLAGRDDNFCRIFDKLEEKFPDRFINLQGKTSLLESMEVLNECSFFVGNDTGLPHLAESLNTAGIFILGPTGEEFGFYPHLPFSQVASMDNLWCRPCTTNGKGNCIRSRRYCLENIEVSSVFQQMKRYL